MLSLPQAACEVYCREKRYERFEKQGGRVRHLALYRLAHRILIPILTISTKSAGQRLLILRDGRKRTHRPTIFCPTHIGGADIEMALEAVHVPCWLALGDPRELYKSVSGMMLQMNGLICLDVLEKRDRLCARAKMEALLKKGGNLLIFPEGAQNVSRNALLSPLYAGSVELAITCGAEIVPMGIERMGDTYFCVLGEPISYEGRSLAERYALTAALRDAMATLKWEIAEALPSFRREELSEKTYEDFINGILSMNTAYSLTVDYIVQTQFHPKNITEPAQAFAHLDNLIPRRENAFLFRK
jgi:hypothetical protein